MAFTRTLSGLDNQHLFYDVDYIVYVEGGKSFTKNEIDQGLFNEKSIDTLFWERIFNKFSKSKYKFKAIGSKSALINIAEDIMNNYIPRTYVAMDQEFDMILSTNFSHPNIVYTYGYSWENDVWNENVIKHILDFLTAENSDLEIIRLNFYNFLQDIKIPVYADGYLFTKSQSFFPRPHGHMRVIECNVNNKPIVKKAEIKTLMVKHGYKYSTIYNFGYRYKIDSKRNCYGHLLGDYCKNLIKHMLKTIYNLIGISDELIRRTAISIFQNYLDINISNHYSPYFNRLIKQ